MDRMLRRVVVACIVGLLALAGLASPGVARQGEGFPLPANTAYCEPGYLGPFVGCTPWEGVTVTYTSADGAFTESCVTAATWERSATCEMTVPFGSTVTASIDPAVIPAGFVLEGPAALTFEIPDGPPEGLFGGPSFVLLPAEGEQAFTMSMLVAKCADPSFNKWFDGCEPWDGAEIRITTADGQGGTCVTASASATGPASCSVEVPYDTDVTVEVLTAPPAGWQFAGAPTFAWASPSKDQPTLYSDPRLGLIPAIAPAEGSIDLIVDAAYCEPGYLGPFVGCTPWEGLTVSFESTDAPISTTCVTVATWERSATCTLPVPYGSTIEVSIDPASIPAGYVLEGDTTQVVTLPDGPPDGPYGGAAFVLLPTGEAPGTEAPGAVTVPVSAFAAVCPPEATHPFMGCQPWNGLSVTFTPDDGSTALTCVTASDPAGQVAGCAVDVPAGTTITAAIDPATLPDGYVMQGPDTVTFQAPVAPVPGLIVGPAFTAEPIEGSPVIEPIGGDSD
jgi:hypothetical protein